MNVGSDHSSIGSLLGAGGKEVYVGGWDSDGWCGRALVIPHWFGDLGLSG